MRILRTLHISPTHYRILTVAGTTILLWDTVITLPDEVAYIWNVIVHKHRATGLADVVYLWQRYGSCTISVYFLTRTSVQSFFARPL